jgi:neuralized-like protein 4
VLCHPHNLFLLWFRYALDLDTLGVHSRVGMSRSSVDGCLHFWLNGADKGPACSDVPTNVYTVIDLYGQCSQVKLTQGKIALAIIK